jgi:hypothetical protein
MRMRMELSSLINLELSKLLYAYSSHSPLHLLPSFSSISSFLPFSSFPLLLSLLSLSFLHPSLLLCSFSTSLFFLSFSFLSSLHLSCFTALSHTRVYTKQKTKELPNPEPHANFVSRLLFLWINDFIKKGYERPVTDDDVWAVPDEDSVEPLEAALEANWDAEVNKKKYGGKY